MKKPVILLTVCRRYYELSRAIDRIWEGHEKGEFSDRPEVWVVWARPELSRLWFFNGLVEQGRVHRVVSRLAIPGEHDNGATSYPESHNLRVGLEAIKKAHDDPVYVIGQAGDVVPNPGIYKYVDDAINGEEKHEAVVFHWNNGCCHDDIWHTNFFVVPTDEAYWPPLSCLEEQDVLERQWGKLLLARHLPGICRSHNNNEKKFRHSHLSEAQPPWPEVGLVNASTFNLHITGYRPWWRRLLDWFVRTF